MTCDLDLYLYHTDQSTELDYSESVTDNEHVSYSTVSSGWYYLIVNPWSVTGSVPYDLWINATYPDDSAEENDYPGYEYNLNSYVNSGWVGYFAANDASSSFVNHFLIQSSFIFYLIFQQACL